MLAADYHLQRPATGAREGHQRLRQLLHTLAYLHHPLLVALGVDAQQHQSRRLAQVARTLPSEQGGEDEVGQFGDASHLTVGRGCRVHA